MSKVKEKKKNNNKHLNIVVTEDEYVRIKKVFHKYGSLSSIVRSFVMRVVKEQEALNSAENSVSMGEEAGRKGETVNGEPTTESGDTD